MSLVMLLLKMMVELLGMAKEGCVLVLLMLELGCSSFETKVGEKGYQMSCLAYLKFWWE
jgi:hypothetical protein